MLACLMLSCWSVGLSVCLSVGLFETLERGSGQMKSMTFKTSRNETKRVKTELNKAIAVVGTVTGRVTDGVMRMRDDGAL